MNRQQRRAEKALQQVSPQVVQKLFVAAYRHHQSRRLDKAIAGYREVIELAPNYADAHNNLGMTLNEMGRAEDAIACYRQAIQLKPDLSHAHYNLGNALKAMGRAEGAISCYRRAIELTPAFPAAHTNLGIGLMEMERLDEAIVCYRRAIALKPDLYDAHYNLGNALKAMGRVGDAISCYRRAIELTPNAFDAHKNLALALLLVGDMAAGWDEYDWCQRSPKAINRGFLQPLWRGEVANGRTILIHAEQGFGDTLQFCRYAQLAASRGLRVIMEVQKPLVRLLRTLPSIDAVVGQNELLPQFDLQIPMMSLPLAFGTTLKTIPSASSYVHAEKNEIEAWRIRLAKVAGIRVGLAWAGNPQYVDDRRRSVPPVLLAPLFEVDGVHFIDLQKSGPAAPATFPLIDFTDDIRDFADTAALIANLDLVISVDTAVAHLAAALGKPVWMLNRFDSCWRWLTEREDSPWYPTMRLFRQHEPGDWTSVVERVRSALSAVVASASP
jgi:Flp pilus assembly protein TadD